MPDDRRFAVIWISERALAAAYGLEGAFSSVSIKLLRDAVEGEVIGRLDALGGSWSTSEPPGARRRRRRGQAVFQ